MGESRLRYHLLALAVVLVWGVTFVCTKVLIGAGLHPVDIFWIRFVLAYAGIWLYILLTGRDRTLWYGWKEELVFLFLGITGGSFYFLTENTALAHTQASNVSFLVCSAPLFTAIFTLLYRRFGKGRFADSLEKVRLGWPLIGGTVLALAGMALVAFEGSRLRLSPLGDLLQPLRHGHRHPESLLLRAPDHHSVPVRRRPRLLAGAPAAVPGLGQPPLPGPCGLPGLFHRLEPRHRQTRERQFHQLRLP